MAPPFAPSAWSSALPDLIGEAFPHSRAETRRALVMAAALRTVPPGQPILRQGDDCWLALVLDGYVAVRRNTADGRQLIISIVSRGELASVLPLATRPAAADAVALTPTPAALWHGVEVRSLATIDPGFAVDMLDHVLGTFEGVVGRLDGLIYQDALRRVARVLNEYGDLFFAERPVLTRGHLPTLVGTSREMTGRVLRLLEARRVVSRVGRNRLRLLDAAGLAAIAGARTEPAPRPLGAGSTPPARDDVVRVTRRDTALRSRRPRDGRRTAMALSSSGWSAPGVATGRGG